MSKTTTDIPNVFHFRSLGPEFWGQKVLGIINYKPFKSYRISSATGKSKLSSNLNSEPTSRTTQTKPKLYTKIQTAGQHLKSLNRSAVKNKQINRRFRRAPATGNEPATSTHAPAPRPLRYRLLRVQTDCMHIFCADDLTSAGDVKR